MADLTEEQQLTEIIDAIEDLQGFCSTDAAAECRRIILAGGPLLLRALRDARAENVVLRQRIEDLLNDFADQTMYGEGCVTHAKLRALLAAPTGQEAAE